VHDLSFRRFPAAFRPFNRLYLSLVTHLSTRRAARVIAVSESTRQDVIAFCGVPAGRVVAIPNGVGAGFTPANAEAVTEFRRRKGLPERFVLFLGTLEPRKNLERLIDAYAMARRGAHSRTGGGAFPKLVLAGGKGWFYQTVFARAAELGLSDDVIFPGFVPGD
jgi:glycosyltransferase involved in cell wall biosynthesis